MPRVAIIGGFRCAHVCRTCGGRCILQPHPVNIMHKCEHDHVDSFDPTQLTDAFNSGFIATEQSIYEMLTEECPELDEATRRSMAHEGALKSLELRQAELDSGKETDIYCVCTHLQSGHVGGAGRCKDGECGCEMFVPDKIKLAAVQ